MRGGLRAIHLDGAPFMTPVPAMFDYDLRLKTMNEYGVDVCVVSLTCPNCYWGGPEVSLQGGADHERRHDRSADRAPRRACAGSRRCRGSIPSWRLPSSSARIAAGASA